MHAIWRSKKKVCYILHNVDYAVSFEWIVSRLIPLNLDFCFIFIGDKPPLLKKILEERYGVTSFYLKMNSKKSLPSIWWRVIKLLSVLKPDVVHTHLPIANLVGLSAAKLLGIKSRIYTRHHSTFHHEYYPRAVWLDKVTNKLSTKIIAISQNVRNILTSYENVSPDKIAMIHHGFDIHSLRQRFYTGVTYIRNKYEIPEDAFPIIGMIARYISWKGHEFAIKAFKEIQDKYPKSFFIFANASGPDYSVIHNLITQNLNPERIREINFEYNIASLYHLLDIIVHVPINRQIEAFGQVYVEALAAGTPGVFTLSGVAPEFVRNLYNALVVPFKNSKKIYDAIEVLINNDDLRNEISYNGFKSVQKFDVDIFIKKLYALYNDDDEFML